jgi:hypothetical protein
MLGFLKKIVIGFVALFGLFVLWALWFDSSRMYWLSIANPGKDPVTVKVSNYGTPIAVPAGQDVTVEITGQSSDALEGQDQTFTVERGGKSETLKLKVGREKAHVVLDVAGDSCFVFADVGGLYAGDKLPRGQAPVKILKTYSGQRLFVPTQHSEEFKREVGIYPDVNLGQKLPKEIKVSKSSKSVPSLERLIRVPCDLQGVDLLKFAGSN